MLDKLTYAGNVRNLDPVATDANFRFVHGDICDATLVETLVADVDAIVNFAAEFARRPVPGGTRAVHPDRRVRHLRAARGGAQARGAAVRPGVDRRGVRRRRGGQQRGGRPAAPAQPLLGQQGRRRDDGVGVSRLLRPAGDHHARLEHVRPVPVPREDHPAVHHQRHRRPAAADLRRRERGARLHPRRRPRARHRHRAARGHTRARTTTSGTAVPPAASRSRTWCWRRSTSRLRSSSTCATGSATTGATRSTATSCAQLGWRPLVPLDRGLRETVDWYRDNEAVVAAAEIGRVLGLLPPQLQAAAGAGHIVDADPAHRAATASSAASCSTARPRRGTSCRSTDRGTATSPTRPSGGERPRRDARPTWWSTAPRGRRWTLPRADRDGAFRPTRSDHACWPRRAPRATCCWSS